MMRTFEQLSNFVILPSCSGAVQSLSFNFQGIPPAWLSTLSELGYSEGEIALILKGCRDRAPDPSVHDCSPTVTPSLSS